MHCTRLTLRSWSGSDFYAQSNKRQNLLSHLDIFHVALIVDRSVSSPCCWFHFIFRDDWIKRVKRGGRGRSAWFIACLYTLRADKACLGVWRWNARERQHQSLNLRVILHLIMVSRRLLQALKLWSLAQKSPWNNMIYSGPGIQDWVSIENIYLQSLFVSSKWSVKF